MNETDLLRATIAERDRTIVERINGQAQEHVNAAMPVLDGITHLLRLARSGDSNAKSLVDSFLKELQAYQFASVVKL